MKKHILHIFTLLLILTGCREQNSYYRFSGYAQGGTYTVTYSSRDTSGERLKISPDSLKSLVDNALLAIDKSLSGYNKGSIISKVNSNESDSVDHLFEQMYRTSTEIYLETDGKFDPSAAPLFDIWGFGFQNRERVSQYKIDSIKQFVGMEKGYVSEGKLFKSDPRFKLNFNAIAQGYSCDIVAAELDKLGLCNYLVEVGMEIYCRGLNPSGNLWKIGVDTPEDGNMEAGKSLTGVIEVTDAGIVTSGNYRKFFIEEGQKFSHTIDPVSGYPVKHNLLSATIIAPNATLADAYATYCMVIGLEEAKSFLASRPDLKGYLIYGTADGGMETYYTENLKSQLVKQ
jgi:thiamine biosynthesis lipoprotein